MIVVKNDQFQKLKLMAASQQSLAALLSLLQLPIASVLVQSYLVSRVATLGEQVLLRTLLKRLQWHSK